MLIKFFFWENLESVFNLGDNKTFINKTSEIEGFAVKKKEDNSKLFKENRIFLFTL